MQRDTGVAKAYWTSKKCQWVERHSTLEKENKKDSGPYYALRATKGYASQNDG